MNQATILANVIDDATRVLSFGIDSGVYEPWIQYATGPLSTEQGYVKALADIPELTTDPHATLSEQGWTVVPTGETDPNNGYVTGPGRVGIAHGGGTSLEFTTDELRAFAFALLAVAAEQSE